MTAITVAEGVTVDPEVMGGQPCITGHRWPTKIASSFARAGYSVSHIIEQYPWITAEQIAHALAWQGRRAADRKKAIADAQREASK